MSQNGLLFQVQEIQRAIPNAATAARPPITRVWSALRKTGTPVNFPFAPPKTASAMSVTITDRSNAVRASGINR